MRWKAWIRHSGIIVVLGLLSWLGLGVVQQGRVGPPSAPGGNSGGSQPGYYPVTHVTDGDTIDVKIAGKTEIVRLLGMDTPETHDPRKAVQCYGEIAAAETRKLVGGKQVRLAGDSEDSDRDKYHRLLRYVYLPDGTFVNQYLTEQGYAFAYTIFPISKLDQFRAWEAEARAAGRGLWSNCQVHLDGHIEQTNNVGPIPTTTTAN
ncbi:MAG TPA: thermonuclease family protein [Candidatus Saccharimonadales bacterium]|nr:thermonuclease family protein [Candidatus Saccharimonadales bacterium]